MAHEDSHHTLQSLYNFAKEELGPLVIGGGEWGDFNIFPNTAFDSSQLNKPQNKPK